MEWADLNVGDKIRFTENAQIRILMNEELEYYIYLNTNITIRKIWVLPETIEILTDFGDVFIIAREGGDDFYENENFPLFEIVELAKD